MKNLLKPTGAWVVALSSLMLFGCATTPVLTTEEIVQQRAQARWDALISEDYDSAYEYLTEGFRSTQSLNNYRFGIQTQRVSWKSAEVTGVECELELCRVSVSIEYSIHQPVPGVTDWNSTRKVFENWIRSDSGWYHLPTKS